MLCLFRSQAEELSPGFSKMVRLYIAKVRRSLLATELKQEVLILSTEQLKINKVMWRRGNWKLTHFTACLRSSATRNWGTSLLPPTGLSWHLRCPRTQIPYETKRPFLSSLLLMFY